MTSEHEDGAVRPRGDKRVRTRARLLDAALALTREKGFENTTLGDIAARAGVTTGAIYGNFKNRDDLFMALAERQWAPIRPRFQAGSGFAALMQAVADAVIAALPERAPAAAGALSFRAFALRHEQTRIRYRDVVADGYAMGAAWLAEAIPAEELPMPPDAMVRVINALIEGLTVQRLLTPELIDDATIRAAFAALAKAPPSSG